MMQFGDFIGAIREAIYTWEGLTLEGAIVIFVIAAAGSLLWTRFRARTAATVASTPRQARRR